LGTGKSWWALAKAKAKAGGQWHCANSHTLEHLLEDGGNAGGNCCCANYLTHPGALTRRRGKCWWELLLCKLPHTPLLEDGGNAGGIIRCPKCWWAPSDGMSALRMDPYDSGTMQQSTLEQGKGRVTNLPNKG